MRRIFLMFGMLAATIVQSQQVGTGIGTVISALDANTTSIQPTGYYSIKNGINFPATTRSEPWHHFVAFNHGNNNGYQLQLTAPYSNPDNALYFRTVANGSYASWQRVATENSNTFKAAQYFPGAGVWTTTGQLGVGTTTPAASLDVAGHLSPKITASPNTQPTLMYIRGYHQNGLVVHTGGFGTSAEGLNSDIARFSSIETNFVEKVRMVVKGSGNVGIGTNAPKSQLHIVDPLQTGDALTYGGIRLYPAKNATDPHTILGYLNGGLRLAGGSTGVDFSADIILNNSGFDFKTGDGTTATTSKVKILNNGKVGIGKTNPTANIDIYHASDPVSIGLQTQTFGKYWVVSQNNELQLGGCSGTLPGTGAINIQNSGAVAIGKDPDWRYRLSVGGDVQIVGLLNVYNTISAPKIEVKNMTFPDYVFADDYKLRSLSEVETFIGENSHLPEVPSAAHVAENGMDVTEMTNVMLKKIEELTLYLIEQDKKISALQKQNEQLLQSINK